jgi:hypothetical protein
MFIKSERYDIKRMAKLLTKGIHDYQLISNKLETFFYFD